MKKIVKHLVYQFLCILLAYLSFSILKDRSNGSFMGNAIGDLFILISILICVVSLFIFIGIYKMPSTNLFATSFWIIIYEIVKLSMYSAYFFGEDYLMRKYEDNHPAPLNIYIIIFIINVSIMILCFYLFIKNNKE